MKLCLFFTRSVSIESWYSSGLFHREKKIYEELIKNNIYNEIYFITYDKDERIYNKLIKNKLLNKNIKLIFPNNFFSKNKLTMFLYSVFLPILERKIIYKCDVIKSNQVDGSWAAIISKFLFRKKYIFRSGYLPSRNLLVDLKRSRNIIKFNKILAKFIFYKIVESMNKYSSDFTILTSNQDKDYLCDTKAIVIPNYIDTDLFKPLNLNLYTKKILFVGRLSEEKNLFNLIKAITNTKYSLDIYGEGSLLNNLRKIDINKRVTFKGILANDKMPYIYNKYKFFILPSYYEGNPKTLLEAMSCGLVCIGTNVQGINELLNNDNGILIKNTKEEELCNTINSLEKINNIDSLRKNAINFISNHCSFDLVSKKEIFVHKNIIKCLN